MNRVCIRCGDRKPLSEFYNHPGMALGVLGKCKECCKDYQRQRRIMYPDDAKRIDRKKYMKRRSAHMRKSAEYQKWYYSIPENLDRRRQYSHTRRARMHGNIHVPYRRADVFALYPRCLACGSDEHLAIDHVVPVSKGGPDRVENLQTLCRRCNGGKAASYHEYRPAYLLSERTWR